MSDQDKTKQQLLGELVALRHRVAVLEGVETERRRAEEALRQSEGRYRALAESTRDIIYILDRQGTLLYINRAAAQCIGIRSGELVGKRQADLFPPEMAQSHLKRIEGVFTTGEVQEEDESFHFGPQQVWLRVHLLPLRDDGGQITSVMGVCHNITDRKRAEEALQKAHAGLEEKVNARTAELMRANEELAMFRKFAETSGQGFSMADLDGCITYVNPALCRMLGAERPAEVVGKHLSTYFSDESNRKGQLEVRPALKQDGYWQGELAMLSCHGTSIPTWHNTFMIRDEQGVPLRIAVVITDITERKQAEGALQRERRTLEHLLQSSDHERQLIAYEIHDGLAQYLTGAIMHFQMWDELQVQNCAEAAKAFDLGMTLLRQGLGEARRLISGVRPPILDESGIVAALAHLAYDFRTHKGPHVEFRSEVEFGRLAPVLENAIYRIAQEGLTNACKHSKSKNVSVALLQRGDEVRVVICDQGVGFDLATVGEGCFGLEGIRERARLLAGRAVIDSESGKGTRLTVDLPIVLRSENGR